jgi:ubiquinone/menaquinone biosynthesis C-methylase UbiE
LPAADDGTFDVVSCHQGMQFFSDKPSAAREMRRVLAAGGRLAFATWLAIDDIPLMRDLQRVAEWHLGPFVDARHSFGDPDRIRQLLTSAGFSNIQLETVTRTIRLDGGAEIFPRLNAMAVVGMNAAVKAMNEEHRSQISTMIAAESVDAVRAYVEGNELVFDLASTIGVAYV